MLCDPLLQNQCDCRRGYGGAGERGATTGQARQTVEGKGNNIEARQHNQGVVTNRAGQGRAGQGRAGQGRSGQGSRQEYS